MDDDRIRERIRALLSTGEIACDEPEATWAGNGFGKRCSACGEPIRPEEIEFEVDLPSGAHLRLHRHCHALWEDECGAMPR